VHCCTDESSDEKDKLFQRFLKNKQFSSAVIQSTDDRLTITNVKRLARKPGQRQRPKTTAARTLPRFHISTHDILKLLLFKYVCILLFL
jgi:hypothetical protein